MSSSLSEKPFIGITSVITGSPFVRVPVLSNTIALSDWTAWSDLLLLKSMPRCAPSPMPAVIAVGVASPSAQGQAMMSTLMKMESAKENGCPAAKNQ